MPQHIPLHAYILTNACLYTYLPMHTSYHMFTYNLPDTLINTSVYTHPNTCLPVHTLATSCTLRNMPFYTHTLTHASLYTQPNIAYCTHISTHFLYIKSYTFPDTYSLIHTTLCKHSFLYINTDIHPLYIKPGSRQKKKCSILF